MARTQQIGTRDANANAASAPEAPLVAGKDVIDNLPYGEEEDKACALDNINALIRTDMIAMYVHILGFKKGAAAALYNNQQITDLDSLRELDDPTIKELCRQIGKEGHPVSMIS
jgi:hypothetical protein